MKTCIGNVFIKKSNGAIKQQASHTTIQVTTVSINSFYEAKDPSNNVNDNCFRSKQVDEYKYTNSITTTGLLLQKYVFQTVFDARGKESTNYNQD